MTHFDDVSRLCNIQYMMSTKWQLNCFFFKFGYSYCVIRLLDRLKFRWFLEA